MLSVLNRPSDRPALVRGDHVALSARARHIRAEALQQRIRHAGEELHARRLQPINKPSNFNHLSPSFQMRGTSHITICEEIHARRFQLTNKPFCHPFAKTGLTGSLTFCHKVLTRRCHLQNRCEGVSVSAARVFGQSFPRLAQPESNVARDWQDSSSVRPVRDSRPAP